MEKQEFLELLFEELEIESIEKLTEKVEWKELEEFDSLAIMTIISLVDDNFDIQLKAADFTEIITVKDLLLKVNL